MRRLSNVFRQRRLNDDLEEELASHVQEGIERGRSAEEVRRSFGVAFRYREESRDIKLLPWLDGVASDVVFGWRQLKKHRVASVAAVLSLALAIGAATAAFRLVDAVLLRILPVAEPERLFFLATTYTDPNGHADYSDDFDYPTFRQYREAVADRADLMVAGMIGSREAMFETGSETERIYQQYVSGNLFGVFGLQPALGRLLMPNDDLQPGAHPVAVLSYDFWTRRFARDPSVIGKTFRIGNDRLEIVGVAPKGFIGTEPGGVTDIFIPSMMNAEAINYAGWSWFRIWIHPQTGISPEQIQQPLQAVLTHEHQRRVTNFPSDTLKQVIDAYLAEKVLLFPAASGASDIQRQYRRPLIILAVLVALVLLIACANVGNLLTAQAATRAREMALRVSIGAGQWRLIQLVLVESALLAIAASAVGSLFAWWSAPLVVSMLHVPEDPVRLILDIGWRELGFTTGLALLVTLLFGLAPALRTSAVKPMSALKGGEDPHSRRRLMNAMLTAQTAFCVLVLFVAGLFVTTFERLSNRPLGFLPEHVLVIDAAASKEQPVKIWMQVVERLRQAPGVQSVALAGWPLLSRNRWTRDVLLPGHAVETRPPYFLDISPAFFETMHIGLLNGRDLRRDDVPPRMGERAQPTPGVGIVNEAFTRTYFKGQNPVGRLVNVRLEKELAAPMEIVGYVRDAAYYDVREPMHPTVYVPMFGNKDHNTLLLHTAGDPLALAPIMRPTVSEVRPDIRLINVQPQSNFLRWQMLRERLLAALSFFFAVVALVLSAIGLYGVLNYSVTQQRREIGIRMALGARSAHVVRRVTAGLFGMVCLGSAIGVVVGFASARFIQSLLFEVKARDVGIMIAPILTLLGAALLAGLAPAIRAVRIDPAQTLRSE
jgi:predicted permease